MTYDEDDFVLISGLQHFSFCKRQWALIHVENKWVDNFLTADGNILHSRVHNQDIKDMRNGVLTLRGMSIHSTEYGMVGECDAVEFLPSNDGGITLHGKDGLWQPVPVEYKRGHTKVGDYDRIQVTAQGMCLEEMLSCEIEYGYLFYKETRRREKVELTQELRLEVELMLEEMHSYLSKGYTPKVKPSNRCRGCSLVEECMPVILTKREKVSTYIERYTKEDT